MVQERPYEEGAKCALAGACGREETLILILFRQL
jgi:hypothetical protein